MESILPVFQTMLGGMLTLLGVYIVQNKSNKREHNKHYREIIQKCYEHLLSMESYYLEESVNFFKGVRDNDLLKLRKSQHGSLGSEESNKAVALIELYFPEFDDLVEELSSAETEMMNFNSDTISSFSYLSVEKYNQESEEYSEKLGEAIANVKEVLVDEMRRYTAF
ncbi:MAG: hypothetical protein WD071_16750 [Pseudohongiella sp.]|uniref:hypothetical protein n=1 Tax=Pseudohongiella sp. TaxID=1979412 RepID=UPI00349FD612